MSIGQPDTDRRMLPRWQPASATIAAGHIDAVEGTPATSTADEHFEARKLEWGLDPSLEVAAELVVSAVVLDRTAEVMAAARQLANARFDIAPTVHSLALRALGERVPGETASRASKHGRLDPTAIYPQISATRQHIHRNPRDAYARVDLARWYAIIGQDQKAKASIVTALAIAPHDRFVLRSAARFFVHIDEPERAHRLLLRSARLKHDPWLMAAEMAIAQVANLSSTVASDAQRALKQGRWAPFSASELAASFATLSMGYGGNQKARALFNQSLRDPTENTIAQAQWATGRVSGLSVPPDLFKRAKTHEAHALLEWRTGQWDASVSSCWDWADYEPTSSRPMVMGSYVAGVALADGQKVLEFTDRGLAAEPGNFTLLNNKVVGLVYLNRIDDAITMLSIIKLQDAPASSQPALFATTGMLRFRVGAFELGREAYQRAMDHQFTRAHKLTLALAAWHWAIEEAVAGTDQLEIAERRAEKASKDVTLAELDTLRDRFRRAKAEARSLAKQAGKSR